MFLFPGFFAGSRFQIYNEQFSGIMDPYWDRMLPDPAAYQHVLPFFVKISTAVPRKQFKLRRDRSSAPGKTQHPAVVMAAQDQICTLSEICVPISGVVGKQYVHSLFVPVPYQLFHFIGSHHGRKRLFIIKPGNFQTINPV